MNCDGQPTRFPGFLFFRRGGGGHTTLGWALNINWDTQSVECLLLYVAYGENVSHIRQRPPGERRPSHSGCVQVSTLSTRSVFPQRYQLQIATRHFLGCTDNRSNITSMSVANYHTFPSLISAHRAQASRSRCSAVAFPYELSHRGGCRAGGGGQIRHRNSRQERGVAKSFYGTDVVYFAESA